MATMGDREWDVTTRGIQSAHEDVRRLQDRGQLTLGAGLVAGGLTLPLIDNAPDIGFSLGVALVTFAFSWHMNLNAEAAAAAEMRDYLSEQANEQVDGHPFNFEAMGAVGRGHPSTIFNGLLISSVLISFAVAGTLNAFGLLPWPANTYVLPRLGAILLWVASGLLSGFTYYSASLAVSDYREKMRIGLWGADPEYNPPSFVARSIGLVFRRDDQGWDKSRAKSEQAKSGQDQI